MIIYMTRLIILIGFVFILSSCIDLQRELDEKRKTGELRTACSKLGNAVQPAARIVTLSRVKELRNLMINLTITDGVKLDAYIIPSLDEHQSEFVAEYDRRREYISGFSGSYGDAVVTLNKSVLWTDGRYHLQADDQIDCDWLLMRESFPFVPLIPEWLKKEFPNGAIVGVDPKLISQSVWENYVYQFRRSKVKLEEIKTNLIDLIWTRGEGEQKRNKNAFILKDVYSGKNWTTKVSEVRDELKKLSADAMVVTALDEIAWLLNIRGRDVPYNPFVRSYVILDKQDVRFFVNKSQLKKNNVAEYFYVTRLNNTVQILDYDKICEELRNVFQSYKRLLIPTQYASSLGSSRYIHNCVNQNDNENKILRYRSPIIFLKAKKNPTEIKGMHNAHLRDAVAMCDFFHYFEKKVKAATNFTELEVVKLLNDFRFEQEHSLGNSFRTIVAYGSNGAFPHYEPTPRTNANISSNSTLILDSGGQYWDGTTDVTRTLHLGTPTEIQKTAYTRVLMGQIQLAMLIFPENMKTSVADVLVRAPLWEIGSDYLHGTSHGVGSFLSVHEAPISMHYENQASFSETQELKPGYFLSNEPGFYGEGDFGIRLENVLQVVEKKLPKRSRHSPDFLGFETITLVPYEPKLIDVSLLTIQHKRWLNWYNGQIRIKVGRELKRQHLMDVFFWMMEKTKNIPEHDHSNVMKSQPLTLLMNAIFVYLLSVGTL